MPFCLMPVVDAAAASLSAGSPQWMRTYIGWATYIVGPSPQYLVITAPVSERETQWVKICIGVGEDLHWGPIGHPAPSKYATAKLGLPLPCIELASILTWDKSSNLALT
jgi:hypothetical protein